MSIKQVAELAGVSISTVSRCLNTPDSVKAATLTRVKEAIAAVGYSPNSLARNFRRGKTGLVIVVVPSVGVPFLEDVMLGINHAANDAGYSILVREMGYSSEPHNDYLKILFSKECDGIILLASAMPFSDVLMQRDELAIPVVVACENLSSQSTAAASVRVNGFEAAKEATEYLLQLGHRALAFIGGQPNSLLTHDREKGFLAALQTAGISSKVTSVVYCDQTIAGAARAARKLLTSAKPPTAIFCGNDEMALAAMHEAKSLGLNVPRDLSIMGFDNIRFAQIADPPLTTIAQPGFEIGERAMHRLSLMMSGENKTVMHETVHHQLIIRQSAAVPKIAVPKTNVPKTSAPK